MLFRRRNSFSEVLPRKLDDFIARGAWPSTIDRGPTPLDEVPSIVGDHRLRGSFGSRPCRDGQNNSDVAVEVVVGNGSCENLFIVNKIERSNM